MINFRKFAKKLWKILYIKEKKIFEISQKKPDKSEKQKTEIVVRNKVKMLTDELVILKIGVITFGEGGNFVPKKIHYHY